MENRTPPDGVVLDDAKSIMDRLVALESAVETAVEDMSGDTHHNRPRRSAAKRK